MGDFQKVNRNENAKIMFLKQDSIPGEILIVGPVHYHMSEVVAEPMGDQSIKKAVLT